ncbi:iron complex outermembrane receptor protein [Pelomonas aquatica]|uniref:Iron complex outermembrane receptor protein n=1 Tax=Pelomonas aquatica TaxID=431058 RepID=A0ABU1Z9Y9_9BURK|nr:TonB-dependent receptor [Pelomonas aquatica]MDR7297440.1 iron complex outermembrane receptor protein [Pelomonas aquatica]
MNVHRMSHIAAAIAALAAALPAAASEDAPPQPLHRVVVTGSNIKRIDVETSDPVTVLRRADIERSGATTLAGFLQSLPWTTDSLTDVGGSTAFASGATSTALRHLDQQSTLVLLNGRRVAPFGLADFAQFFTNIDTLPLDAIERIEILKSGASAVYGSDAVAGVVNIITRQNYQGFEAGADMGRSLNSRSFGERGFHATAGIGDFDTDGFNVTASVQHYRRDPVVWRDVVDRVSEGWRNTLPQGNEQLSFYSFPGNIAPANTTNWHAVSGCDASLTIDGLCWYDRYKGFEAQPAANRTNLLISAKAAIAPGVEGFAELLWARTKTDYLWYQAVYDSLDPATSWADPKTGTAQSFSFFMLPPTHPLNDTGDYAALAYRFADVKAGQTASASNYRLVTGLRGSAGGYDWETSVAFLGSKASQRAQGIAFSNSGFRQTIGGTTDLSDRTSAIDPDFFNIPNGYRLGKRNSQAVIDALFPTLGSTGKLTQTALDGKISGELAQLPAGPMSFAAGYDLRHERSVITPTDNVQNGDIVGYAYAQTRASRTFGAVFGELDIPVVQTLNAQVAARIDKFPGFGAHLSPKIGLRYQPTQDLLLRGTAESGFRAPNLVEAGTSTKTAFESGIQDPKRCPGGQSYADDLTAQAAALPAGDPARAGLKALAERALAQCDANAVSVIRNNPSLKPEVSRGYSFGTLFEPMQRTSVTLDYWSLSRKNEIRLTGTSQLLEQEGQLPPGLAVQRAPLSQDPVFNTAQLRQQYGITVGQLLKVENRFENTSRTRTDGVDFGVKTSVDTPVGDLELNLMGTWLNRFQAYSTARGGYGDNLAGRYGYSRVSASFSGALTTGAVLNGLKLSYRSGTSLQGDYYDSGWDAQGCAARQLSSGACRLPAYVRTDYFFSYSGVRNLTLSAYVSNVFNRAMAVDRRAIDVTPSVEDAQRRSLHVSVNYKFF